MRIGDNIVVRLGTSVPLTPQEKAKIIENAISFYFQNGCYLSGDKIGSVVNGQEPTISPRKKGDKVKFTLVVNPSPL